MQGEFQRMHLRKRSGGLREVYRLRRDVADYYRSLVPELSALALTLDVYRVAHGFMPGRSPVTNALAHKGSHEATLCMDLKDFFDSLTYTTPRAPKWYHETTLRDSLMERLLTPLYPECMRLLQHRPAAQGFPTSPAVANILMYRFDASLHEIANRRGCVYTRYADDIAISGPLIVVHGMERMVRECCKMYSLQVAEEKTRLYLSCRGARIITGVAVYEDRIDVPRHIKRKLRAARHRRHDRVAEGLAEWCKLKTPNIGKWILRGMDAGLDPEALIQVSSLSR